MIYKYKPRKIQQTLYSRWITLPPEWLDNVGLHRGDVLEVELMADGALRLAPAIREVK